LRGDYYTTTLTFNLENNPVAVPVINDNGVLDMPFLRPDAIAVLGEIINKLKDNFDVKDDLQGNDNKFKKHPIVIKSGLRAGEKGYWNSTGYVFRIQVVGYTGLETILSDMEKEQKGIINRLSSNPDEESAPIFKPRKISGDTYDIMIFPPIKTL
jgi:hypothetical protein